MSNNMKMAGFSSGTWFDQGTRSSSAGDNRPTITRAGARTRAWSGQDNRQRSRAAAGADLATQVADWLWALDGDDKSEAEALLAEYVTGSTSAPERPTTASYCSVRPAETVADRAAAVAALAGTSQLAREEAAEAGTAGEGMARELSLLGMATTVTREEANEADLRITYSQWGYTRGLS